MISNTFVLALLTAVSAQALGSNSTTPAGNSTVVPTSHIGNSTVPSNTVTKTESDLVTITSCPPDKSDCVTITKAPSAVTETQKTTVFTTYCPHPTTFTHGGETFTVTEATTLTITQCDETCKPTHKPTVPSTAQPVKPSQTSQPHEPSKVAGAAMNVAGGLSLVAACAILL